jgi:hypothetical protein
MITFWIVPLVVMVVFIVAVEWTSRPRGARADADVAVPRPRKEVRDDVNSRVRRD